MIAPKTRTPESEGTDKDKDAREFWFEAARARFLNDRDISLSSLDQEIDVLHALVRAAERRRNTMTLASRLPAEILVKIFAFVKDGEPFSLPPEDQDAIDGPGESLCEDLGNAIVRARMGWVTASQVCQCWRQAALGASALWKDIKYRRLGSRWSFEMLRRSGPSSPLSLEMGSYWCPSPGQCCKIHDAPSFFKSAIETDGHRIQQLCLVDENVSEYIAHLDHALPALDSFRIESDFRSHVSLPLKLLAANAPALKNLWLIGITPLGASSTPFRALTCFEFEMRIEGEEHHLSEAQILDIIRQMPSLEELSFTEVGSPTWRGKNAEKDENLSVHLPSSLKTLNITAVYLPNQTRCIEFSHRLLSPSAAWGYAFDAIPPTSLTNLLFQRMGLLNPPTVLHLEIDHAKDAFHLSLSATPWRPSTGDTPLASFELSLSVRQAIHTHFPNPCRGASLGKVEDLTLEDDEETSRERWLALFSEAKHVKRLRIVGTPAFAFFALLAEYPASPAAASQPAIFPKLEGLSVVELDRTPLFGEPAAFRGGEALLEGVRARRARGAPIQDLKIPPRFLGTGWAELLRREVASVGPSREGYY
ncbi:hypothetical protein OF83DRAFT_693744 [Amylostereum chailletii]|nr:hypothetical protein OF83DRAFT_693744 [Amylostereum chailletii]